MLVLSRREGESVVIDGGIEVVVSKVSGDRVRLAIKAPRNIIIMRKELLNATRDQQPERAG